MGYLGFDQGCFTYRIEHEYFFYCCIPVVNGCFLFLTTISTIYDSKEIEAVEVNQYFHDMVKTCRNCIKC